jgi:hypothetical protein
MTLHADLYDDVYWFEKMEGKWCIVYQSKSGMNFLVRAHWGAKNIEKYISISLEEVFERKEHGNSIFTEAALLAMRVLEKELECEK